MKQYVVYIGMALNFLFWGCESEDRLMPSLMETDWADQLDMSNPIVRDFYDAYGVGLMTKYDLNKDLRYNMASATVQENQWNKLLAPELERDTEIDSAFAFVQTTLLQYFTNDAFIKNYFPRKILLARELVLDNTENGICEECMESDKLVSFLGNNSLHSIYTKGSFALSVKLSTIYFNTANFYAYRMDNLYLFLSCLFRINNLYDELGSDFYLPGMKNYYSRKLKEVYIEEGNSEEASDVAVGWYWEKGFVSNLYMNNPTASNKIPLDNNFPDRERDVRMCINQLLFMTARAWNQYPDHVKERLEVLVHKFDEWGIDIRAINPVVGEMIPRN